MVHALQQMSHSVFITNGLCQIAANEPYELWKGLDSKSEEYKALKEQRAEPLWQVGVREIESKG
jgi:hypothetical protein